MKIRHTVFFEDFLDNNYCKGQVYELMEVSCLHPFPLFLNRSKSSHPNDPIYTTLLFTN